MSTNSILSFIAGAVVGALAALLLAPKSGEDLRADLAREARQDRDRLQKEYDHAVKEAHNRLDKIQADVKSTMEHVKTEAESTVSAAADSVENQNIDSAPTTA
jgi:gas vesicle protein